MSLSFEQFIEEKPELKYIFLGGKGGVGKTIVAAGVAYYFSDSIDKKILISSTNPVHSLSSAFGQDIWGKGIQKIDGTKNLYGLEIDISDTVKRYRQQIREMILGFLKYADIPLDPESFIDVATTNPAFEETAMFEDMMDLIMKNEFDAYVFDTAPVAHTYRLLGMSNIYDLWLMKMVKSREEALSTRLKLSFRKEKIAEEIKKDTLMENLVSTRKKTDRARQLLINKDRTAFFFVTLPLALPIAVIERFIGWVQAFNIPTGGIFVNGIMPAEICNVGDPSPYLVNKIQEQKKYLNLIQEKFPNMIRAHVPLFDTEVTGTTMISRVATALKDKNEGS